MMKNAKKKAELALRSEQHEAALDEYEKGLRLLHQKDFQKAIPRFEALLAQYPQEAALCDRARAYLRVATGASKARHALRSTREPADSYDVGLFLLNDGEFKEAARHLERAVEFDAKDPGIRTALASALLQAGDVDGCLREVAAAIELNGKYRCKIRNMTDFDDLEDNPEFSAMVADE